MKKKQALKATGTWLQRFSENSILFELFSKKLTDRDYNTSSKEYINAQ